MANHLPDVTLTNEWQDLTEIYDNIADVKITVQAKFVETCYVFSGTSFPNDGDAPDNAISDGSLLRSGQAITGSASNWFVKGKGKISVFVED